MFALSHSHFYFLDETYRKGIEHYRKQMPKARADQVVLVKARNFIYLKNYNKPLQGMAPTECLPSACLLACLLVCLLVCLLACLLACLPTCLPTCLLACLLACLPACLHACLLACLPAYLHACLLELSLELACLLAYPRTPQDSLEC